MLYKWFYNRLKTSGAVSSDEIYLLSDDEVKQVKKTERNAVIMAALTGALMVLALYFPQYFIPQWFPNHKIWIPLYDAEMEIPIIATIYGVLLVFVEIWILTALNIYSAHKVADVIGFISAESKHSPEKRELLLSLGENKKSKDIIQLGVDPYLGIKKGQVFLLNLFFALKATLSNIVAKMLIQRFLGRYAVREVLDMLGIPIFAFWNAVAARQILRQARIILMGQNLLLYFERELKAFRKLTDEEKVLLYDSLQLIAMSKRDFHRNHYYLTKIVLNHFQITIEKQHLMSEDYEVKVAGSAEDFRALNEKVLVLGFIMDGSVSIRERLKIGELNEQNVMQLHKDDIQLVAKNFVYGKGII